MACSQHIQMFDDGDSMFLGDGDLFGSTVPCIAGELELQVQSYEAAGDVPVLDPAEGKAAFSLTKDSGGSSLSALAAADFVDTDFMDNVSLDDLAAADHFEHTLCGRQSTADSTAAASSGRIPGADSNWNGLCTGPDVAPRPTYYGFGLSTAADAPGVQVTTQGQESSDCDISHTHGDGESSGVGPGKSVALGCAHSEASEDNTAGVTPGAAVLGDEELISMPSYGLSLSRLTQGGAAKAQQQQDQQTQHQHQQITVSQQAQRGMQQHQQALQQSDQQQQQVQQAHQQQAFNGTGVQQQRTQMTRAFSVDNFALAGSNNNTVIGGGLASSSAYTHPDSGAGGGTQGNDGALRRSQVYRSFSYMDPDTLPMDFVLGCGDAARGGSGQFTFGARGRCASLNETQLRRQWLQEGELLAPQLPPSVSELELLELPEDSIPVRPSSSRGGAFVGQQDLDQELEPLQQQPSAGGSDGGDGFLASGAEAMGGIPGALGGLMQFTCAGSSSSAAAASAAASAAPGVTVTVKRKIITSPSPLLQQPRAAKARQQAAAAAAAAAAATGSTAKGQSPKRAKLCAGGAWQDGATGGLAGWHPPRQGGGGMKTVRSMPANLNSFIGMDSSIEVTVQPLGEPGPAGVLVGPAGAGTVEVTLPGPHPQAFARGKFFDTAAAGSVAAAAASSTRAAAGLGVASVGPQAGGGVATAKGARSKAAAAVQPLQSAGVVSAVGMPGPFMALGGLMGPDGTRLGPVPSIPKPRKRASPNGNPPKAPAPNPNGHCCTQCGTQTTPVWRAGPHGPKTLCNACGVRYMKVAKGNVAPTPRRQQH